MNRSQGVWDSPGAQEGHWRSGQWWDSTLEAPDNYAQSEGTDTPRDEQESEGETMAKKPGGREWLIDDEQSHEFVNRWDQGLHASLLRAFTCFPALLS